MGNMFKTCLECKDHLIIGDPDPNDWFCDDDKAVVCTKTPNPNRNLESSYAADFSEYRAVTVSCRPYNLNKETEVPKWCPLILSNGTVSESGNAFIQEKVNF